MKQNPGSKIKMGIMVLIGISLLVSFYILVQGRAAAEDFISLTLFRLVLAGSVWFGFTTGLVFSLLGVLVYGFYYFITSVQAGFAADIGAQDIVWIAIMPLGALVGGFVGDTINYVERLFKKYEREIKSLLLTGQLGMVGNEETFMEGLKEECARARRSLSRFSVVLLEALNLDELERKLGADAVVQISEKMSEVLCRSTRDIDRKSKFQDTRHGVILVDCSQDFVNIILDRIRKNLNQTELEYRGRQLPIRIKPAFGVAIYPENGESASLLIDYAEADLEKHVLPSDDFENGKKKLQTRAEECVVA